MTKQYGTQLDDYGFELYEENAFPLAYLITFRTFGTWLHGDERTSIQREHDGRRRTSLVDPNHPLEEAMRNQLSQSPMILTPEQRSIVEASIRETCEVRRYGLHAVNIRTNHGHSVISAAVKPEKIVIDLKAYSTRHLREAGEFCPDDRIWARGASTRYLWKPRHVEAAVDYVLYSQGDLPFYLMSDVSED